MDAARYRVAPLAVVTFPPAVLNWFLLHPFVRTWRRLGGPTIAILLAVYAGMAWAIFAAPLANHLVTYPEAPATAAGLVAVAWLEERESPESFGGRYADQRRRVPMFIPRPGSD